MPKPSELTKYPTPSRNYVRKDYAPDKFAPAGNAFDLSLILSWITSQERTIPKQLQRIS